MTNDIEALLKLESLIDPKCGLLRRAYFTKHRVPEPPLFCAYAEGPNTKPLLGLSASNKGAACSVSPERAMVRACGEAIERYGSCFCPISELVFASESDFVAANAKYISLRDIYSFHEEQTHASDFPFVIPTEETKMRWVSGCGAVSKTLTYVPASCVYVPYMFRTREEPFTHMPISTGLAAGVSVNDCISKGICEVLERDALMVTWLARLNVPQISLTSCFGLSLEIDTLLESCIRFREVVLINLITIDIEVPVISVSLTQRNGRPMTAFGVAANCDPVLALRNALEEALLSCYLLNRGKEIVQERGEHRRVSSLRDHLLAHATRPTLRDALLGQFESHSFVSMQDVIARFGNLAGLVETVTDALSEPIFVDVTPEDIEEVGLKIVRTIVPGARPLDSDHRYPYSGGSRIHHACKRMQVSVPEQFQDLPHPFP